VVVGGAQGKVSRVATARRRRQIREARIGHPIADGAATRRSVPASGMRISEYLQRTSGGATQCTWCGCEVAPAGVDWKEHAVLRRVPTSQAGPLRTGRREFALIEACCPQCGTLLDTDLAAGDDPPLHDRIIQWPVAGP
jgi:hypothetical protein